MAKPLFHNERWTELEPEFVAAAALREALDALSHVKAHSPGSAHCARMVEQGLAKLHPLTRDPAAWEELEQRKAGTFQPDTVAPPAPDMLKRIRELEAMVAKLREQPPAPPAPPASPEG